MAVVAHFVYRDASARFPVIDGIHGVIVAIDDAVDTTNALVRTRAETILNEDAEIPVPAGYFTANRLCTVYDAADDITVLGKDGEVIYEAIA